MSLVHVQFVRPVLLYLNRAARVQEASSQPQGQIHSGVGRGKDTELADGESVQESTMDEAEYYSDILVQDNNSSHFCLFSSFMDIYDGCVSVSPHTMMLVFILPI